ncbi:head decoration protein [Brachybacterium sp. DNPG3]
MDLTVRDEVFGSENRAWLGSQHGTESNRSITLDVAAFTAATHYPNGVIPSGTVLAVIAASGLYGPYDPDAEDGRDTAAGHLFNSTPVRAGATKLGAPLLDHGAVVESKLPAASGLDALAKADLAGQIRYR